MFGSSSTFLRNVFTCLVPSAVPEILDMLVKKFWDGSSPTSAALFKWRHFLLSFGGQFIFFFRYENHIFRKGKWMTNDEHKKSSRDFGL